MTKIVIETPEKPVTPLTDDENRKHKKSKYCHICLDPFFNNEDKETIVITQENTVNSI